VPAVFILARFGLMAAVAENKDVGSRAHTPAYVFLFGVFVWSNAHRRGHARRWMTATGFVRS
jgi:hypothetical protein